MIETAVYMALAAMMLTGLINIGYVVYMGAGVASAARQGAVFAAQGASAPAGASMPTAAAACTVSTAELTGWLALPNSDYSATASNSSTSSSAGWSSSSSCGGNTNATSPTYVADPESGYFTSNAVSINAGIKLPIPLLQMLGGSGTITIPAQFSGRPVYFRQSN